MKRSRDNPYSTELAYLRDYLKRGFDPYDYANLLQTFFDRSGDEYPDEFDPDEPWEYPSKMSKAELKAFEDFTLNYEVDALTPSTAFYTFRELVRRNTWLIHFSDYVDKIIDEGLACGHEDMQSLGLTTHFSKKKCNPGWNFAFDVNGRDAKRAANDNHGRGKYGRDAVIFQSAGVEAYHSGDQEYQVIFQGATVHDLIPIYRDGSEWRVENNKTGRAIYQGDFDDVVGWVVRNARSYARSIMYFRGN